MLILARKPDECKAHTYLFTSSICVYFVCIKQHLNALLSMNEQTTSFYPTYLLTVYSTFINTCYYELLRVYLLNVQFHVLSPDGRRCDFIKYLRYFSIFAYYVRKFILRNILGMNFAVGKRR